MGNRVIKTNKEGTIWKNFKEIIEENVVSTIIAGNITVTIKSITNEFPFTQIENSAIYPIIVIETPSLPTENLTFKKEKVNGSINISVYTNQAQSAEAFLSLISDAIDSKKHVLSELGIKQIQKGETTGDMVVRGGMKIHVKTISIEFKCGYIKEVGF